MKVALVHDWLSTFGGAEKVLSALLELFPDAEVFSLVDHLSDHDRQMILSGRNVHTSFIQKLPFSKKHFRQYLPLFPLAIETLDLRGYDLVISSSYAVAKGVITSPDQTHVCYCHSPMRYAWDMHHEYLERHHVNGIKGVIVRQALHKIRIWDVSTSPRVNHFIANSNHVAKRIEKYYGRKSYVIHPPVDTSDFALSEEKDDYYFTASRLVPYKNITLIVEAFNQMGLPLKVAGEGSEYQRIKKMAKSNIDVMGHVTQAEMVRLMQKAKAFLFAAYEDFGIVPVEAMACGTPVIAYGRGGALETVVENETGLFFNKQEPEEIVATVTEFENSQQKWEPKKISQHAEKFSKEHFIKKISEYIQMEKSIETNI